MKTIMYGSKICPDSLNMLDLFEKNDIMIDFRDITTDLGNLKAFLALREGNAVFDKARLTNKIGIPFFILPDGTQTIDEAQALFALMKGGNEK
ncbi:MAG: glutaredoxin [Flexilinea sp.]